MTDATEAAQQPVDSAVDSDGTGLADADLMASELAAKHFSAAVGQRFPLQRYLALHDEILQKAHQRFASEPHLSASAPGEWFLDNYHVIQQALRQVRTDVPPSFLQELPTIDSLSGRGCPRILAIAREIVRSSDNYLVLERVRRFMQNYQAVGDLTMGELWALPSMLRLSVVENLTRASAEIVGLQLAREGLPGTEQPSTGRDLAHDRRVANCILSLRGLAAHDWNEFFESVSLVEKSLREDPASVYSNMDFETRDQYRKVVEQLASAAGKNERQVAQAAIEAAASNDDAAPYQGHVGFYLVGEGRAQLERQLGCRLPPLTRVRRWMTGHPTAVYLGGILALTVVLMALLLTYVMSTAAGTWTMIALGALTIVPTTAVAVYLVDWVITHILPPTRLPTLDYEEGIPAQSRTLVVMPTMLTDSAEVDDLLRQLEQHYLANSDANLGFALLTDFTDAPRSHMPNDDQLVDQAISGLRELNERHGHPSHGPFYLFHRERQWNPAEELWMGWERKRGKLADLNRLLLGDREEIHFTVQEGDLDALDGVRYVITVDRDTIMPQGSARRLVATMAHPLNQPRFDPQSERVVAGYTVLQPRLEVWPATANQSLFSQVFAGDSIVDLYTRAVSNAYQDLFGEGIYAGKGIYDVAAFERSLAGRVPANSLLSHDLFEGVHGRAGLCSTVTFYEDIPQHYLAYAYRQHRWIRGDWQLLPWLFPRVPAAGPGTIPNRLSAIDRWKVLDNLRRSLLAPSMLMALVAGWLLLPGSALGWTLLVLLASGFPFLSQTFTDVLAGGLASLSSQAGRPAWPTLGRWVLSVSFLAYETLMILDAVGSTLVRLFISRRHLLQWTTAAHTIRLFRRERKLALAWLRMGSASILSLLVGLLLLWQSRASFPYAVPLLLAWLLSPQIAHLISQPIRREAPHLSEEQRQRLRAMARRTWFYFESFVGPEDHWLTPDHYQEQPLGQRARRTSPTNIGLQLLSTLAAYDMGYLGPREMAYQLRFSFDSMSQMERYRGHFLNWYDTRDLRPLAPRYVSTVDSGNLAACLMALRQGFRQIPGSAVLRWRAFEGLIDNLVLLAQAFKGLRTSQARVEVRSLEDRLQSIVEDVLASRDDPQEWRVLLATLSGTDWPDLLLALQGVLEDAAPELDVAQARELRAWSELTSRWLQNAVRAVDGLLPWLLPLSEPPSLLTSADEDTPLADGLHQLREELTETLSLEAIPAACETAAEALGGLMEVLAELPEDAATKEAADWCSEMSQRVQAARRAALDLMAQLENLAIQAEDWIEAMDFGFLFDERREVFHIGYNATAARMDKNYYDLLASEARLASIVAIAKGDVPPSHWLHLSRAFTKLDGDRALLSWSGTMFEYLMPTLLARSYPGTLLEHTNSAVVERQIRYGRERGVPWGISESGYYRFDAGMAYQYRAFGVPGLGLKRGLGKDLVVAPYASMLALSLRPQAVMENLDALQAHSMIGHYGLYESIDYTPSRLPPEQDSAVVRSYMAHHQGMILLSIANYLQGHAMVERFHADPRIQATDLVLHEHVPSQVEAESLRPEQSAPAVATKALPSDVPYRVSMRTPVPETFLLSNGSYSVLLTNAGSGYSKWNGLALTRWRPDTTLDDWGTWIYVQDRAHRRLWSAGYQPTTVNAQRSEVVVHAHKVEFRRQDHDISVRTEVTVSPDDEAEIRRVTLTNESNRRRRLWLNSYAEVVLGQQGADVRHPAFGKLFVQSEFIPELNTLLFWRRPRSEDEEPAYLAHVLVTRGLLTPTRAYETDRARFLGRGHTPHAPAALQRGRRALSGSAGVTLDPIMSIGQSVRLLPHTTASLAYITLAAPSREQALAMARRYQSWLMVRRAFGRARDEHREELRALDMGTAEFESAQKLLSVLHYPHHALRADPATLSANRLGQAGLWPFAISGDYPILLLRLQGRDDAELLYQVLRAHTYWRRRELLIDLVILNERETSYVDDLHGFVHRLIARMGAESHLNQRGGVFVLRSDQLDEHSRTLLLTAARAIVGGDAGSLSEQVARLSQAPTRLPALVPTLSAEEAEAAEPTPALERPTDLLFDNGLGGFGTDGREYVVYLESGLWSPAPWVNVVANPGFGFLISEAGSGFTWAGNSGENRLTPWRNDPVMDQPGEALYLRDEETAEIWSPTPQPARARSPYLVRHGAGYTVFEHHSHGLKQYLRIFAAPEDPVKVIHLRVQNTRDRHRRLTSTYFAEWVLGNDRGGTQQYIVPEFDASRNVLMARNTYSAEFAESVAFLAASDRLHGLTCDRTEFLGRDGSLARPAGLVRLGLSATVAAGLDPCAVTQMHIDLAPGESKEVFFLLGQGADRTAALRLVEKYQSTGAVEEAWDRVRDMWDQLLGAVQVRTPQRSLDLLLNRWLLYQACSCRLWARSAMYQSSGAYGFRDQLQDVMALTHAAPHLAREHILRAAQHQFEEGDVLHWWHPPGGRGVRTRYSDDLLWLPFSTAHYVQTTGDYDILHEEQPFRKGPLLEENQVERYGHFQLTDQAFALYEHCCRALTKSLTEGPHGLPLIGGGDWNDGLNRVGLGGRGESIWLGWFLCTVLKRFIPICEREGDEDRVAEYRQRLAALEASLEEHAWDGDWYRRAYFDDGTPLGSAQNAECEIAAMSQSWAVLSEAAGNPRAQRAMDMVWERLIRQQERLALLFTPPFDKMDHHPGYIMGYPPGIRENGGQYTHAAMWTAWAYALLGQGDRAGQLFELLNPIERTLDREGVARYRREPYVLTGDVYSHPEHLGCGGWSWYTGSAGWMYRLGVEAILGLQRNGNTLRLEPCVPEAWDSFSIDYRNGDARYHILVHNPQGVQSGVQRVTLDGEDLSDGSIRLETEGGSHQVEVWMG